MGVGFHAEMRTAPFTGDLKLPAYDHPLQDLHRGGLQVGAAERCHAQLPLWVTHQYKADVDRWTAARVPQGGEGKAPQLLTVIAIPVHFDDLPRGIGAFSPGLQPVLALALQRFGAAFARGLGAGRMIQGGIPAPPRDHSYLALHTGQRQ